MNRRTFLHVTATSVAAACAASRARTSPNLVRPRPSASQLSWQRDELALFLHFGVNTFTDREWGDGSEDPAIFAPSRLDARQWARVARAAGFRAMILTAKHHDGFCLWPTRTTEHSVAKSPFRSGQGGVVRELVDCRSKRRAVSRSNGRRRHENVATRRSQRLRVASRRNRRLHSAWLVLSPT